MKTFALALALLGLIIATGSISNTHAQPEPKPDRVMLVVHADNKAVRLDKTSVKNVYLGQQQFWGNDVRIKPFNRAHNGAVGKPFFRDILGMTPSRYRHHWQKQQLSGQGVEPEVVGTAASVVAKVAASSGGIGYILESEASAVDTRVKMIPIE